MIGGGITGAGIARDAAMRGLRVALIEARDFASGTSSRSTKLVHGGIRYLLQGDLKLVREAARDRQVIANLAAHLAQPTCFLIPARHPGQVLKFRTGLWLYERIGQVPAKDHHQHWSRAELKAREPLVDPVALGAQAGVLAYPEYLTDDARLTLANLRSAQAHGALVLNYVQAVGCAHDQGRVNGVYVTDNSALTPTSTEPEAQLLKARCVVNAAGPWVDQLRLLETPAATKQLCLTKGVHLVVPSARLPLKHTLNLKAADGRGIFVIPRGPSLYIGTTDTFYPDNSYWPEITTADVTYLLATVNRALPDADLTPADISSLWSGLRPLIAQPGRQPSEISRRDLIMQTDSGLVSIAGGKLTAFRRMAQRVVDHCQQLLGAAVSNCRTDQEPLPGASLGMDVAALRQTLRSSCSDADKLDRLVSLYGQEASGILAEGGDVAAEARFAVLTEGALHLEDYWARRSARMCFDTDAGMAALAPAAAAMAPLLGWSDAEQARQIAHCQALYARDRACLHLAPASGVSAIS